MEEQIYIHAHAYTEQVFLQNAHTLYSIYIYIYIYVYGYVLSELYVQRWSSLTVFPAISLLFFIVYHHHHNLMVCNLYSALKWNNRTYDVCVCVCMFSISDKFLVLKMSSDSIRFDSIRQVKWEYNICIVAVSIFYRNLYSLVFTSWSFGILITSSE